MTVLEAKTQIPIEMQELLLPASDELVDITQERDDFMRIFSMVSESPTGGDPFIGLCFKAGLELSQSGDTRIIDNIIGARIIRSADGRPLTKAHGANLATHIINHIMINDMGKPDFIHDADLKLDTAAGWKDLWLWVLKEKRGNFIESLVNKDIQTNDQQRGVDYPFILHTAFGNDQEIQEKGLTVVDLGCSANWIWSNLANGVHFEDVVDVTEDPELKGLIAQKALEHLPLKHVVGIDRQDPLSDIPWYLACRHFREVSPTALKSTVQQIEKYRNHTPNVSFVVGDVIGDLPIGDGVADVVTISTMLYQLPAYLREEVLKKARLALNPEKGLLIIKDYVSVGEDGNLVFTSERGPGTYRTLVSGPKTGGKWLEVVNFESTRCKKLEAGRGMKEFINTYS